MHGIVFSLTLTLLLLSHFPIRCLCITKFLTPTLFWECRLRLTRPMRGTMTWCCRTEENSRNRKNMMEAKKLFKFLQWTLRVDNKSHIRSSLMRAQEFIVWSCLGEVFSLGYDSESRSQKASKTWSWKNLASGVVNVSSFQLGNARIWLQFAILCRCF